MKGITKKWMKRLSISEGVLLAILALSVPLVYAATEAPAGFDNLTNGFITQAQFDLDRAIFDELEQIDEGLGPVYNAQGCGECHQNPVSGATSQITELRAGHSDAFGNFVDAPGGSLINDRAIDAKIQERLTTGDPIVTERTSRNVLGDGFVEAIADSTFTSIRNSQPAGMQGQIINVPILEASGFTRVGRFGWKGQHGSLLSFAAYAYLNEMGITSPMMPDENTSSGEYVGWGTEYDPLPEPENDGEDVAGFALFMRSTKAPPRGEITVDAIRG